ncbi:putative bifunctional diguanylate cyclase/phosphodiesterase [Halomicronema hongdechloris]|nr:EAL domain-containing protein [Halomicronema hongdechloris]
MTGDPTRSMATILVVEDERLIARDIQAILEDLGYVVPEIVDAGEQAILKAAELQPDLILMDIHLIGEMDGIMAAHEISAQFEIPIIYLTAHADEHTLARAKLTGPFGYILKPFEERELRTTIEIALYKHQIEQQLQQKQEWLATILGSMGDGVVATDQQGRVTFMNQVAQGLTGWDIEVACGRPVELILPFISQDTEASIPHPITQALADERTVYLPNNALLLSTSGHKIPVGDSASPIRSARGNITGAVMVFQDVTERRQATELLRHQALHDALTNLPNRAWLLTRLDEEIKRARRDPSYQFGLLFLDLDRFKAVNDSLGHAAGDQLLMGVAQQLLSCVRDVDFVARMGGDEFAIVLADLQDLRQACRVAERILEVFAQPLMVAGHELFANASIGIVLSSQSHLGDEEILQAADIAMYRAKHWGIGSYEIFDSAMGAQIQAALRMEGELRQAIERSELQVFYQPIVSLADGAMTGMEALVRWQHPQRGLITPDEFMPMAEETGLSVLLDWWVLRETCRQIQSWDAESDLRSHLLFSINFSSRQFAQPNFVQQVETILAETGIAAHRLKFEITESAIIHNPKSAATVLEHLKSLGIQLALDDFGTGYSSLSYLHGFPVDTLKIDRSFIQNLETDPKSLEIVRTILLLARALDKKVIAEGVETPDQCRLLQSLQCDLVQGYFFSRPVTSAMADAFPMTWPGYSSP